MSRWTIWEERLARPTEPTTTRIHTPWIVLKNTDCPVCNIAVDTEGRITHGCGETLDVRPAVPLLLQIIRYPIGVTLVRSEKWERFLVKNDSGIQIRPDHKVPISSLHAAPWIIWNGDGVPPPHWSRPHHCPECDKPHSNQKVTFRCECQARLFPVSMNWLFSVEKKDLVARLWEEQAFFLKVKGVHMLLSTYIMPP